MVSFLLSVAVTKTSPATIPMFKRVWVQHAAKRFVSNRSERTKYIRFIAQLVHRTIQQHPTMVCMFTRRVVIAAEAIDPNLSSFPNFCLGTETGSVWILR